jgi:hypothetical protein
MQMIKPQFAALALLAGVAATPAHAMVVNFTYSGFFGSRDSLTPAGVAEAFFAPATPFELEASFDDSSPNLVAGLGIQGFIAHTPISARMTIGGIEYSVAAFPDDQTGGITIAIFDQTNPFVPGKYGVGFIVDPELDGAGIIGRFGDATTNFTVDALVQTELTDFIGAGFRSGPGAPPGKCYADPSLCAIVPITLSDMNGAQYGLRLGTRAENYVSTGLLHTAAIAPVPAPGSLALVLAGIAGVSLRRRRRAN